MRTTHQHRRRRTAVRLLLTPVVVAAACLVPVQAVPVQAVPVQAAPATAVTPTGYTFHDLGAEYLPVAVNNSQYVVTRRSLYVPSDDQLQLWHDGTVATIAGAGAGEDPPSAFDISDGGLITGTTYQRQDDGPELVHPTTWTVTAPGAAHVISASVHGTDVVFAQWTDSAGRLTGRIDPKTPAGEYYTASVLFASPSATPVEVGGGFGAPTAASDDSFVCGLSDSGQLLTEIHRANPAGLSGYWLMPGPDATPAQSTRLDLSPTACSDASSTIGRAMSHNGWITGRRTSDQAAVVRAPDGTETVIGDRSVQPISINDAGAVLAQIDGSSGATGTGGALLTAGGTRTLLSTLLPSGWKNMSSQQLDDNGDIIGACTTADGTVHGCVLLHDLAPEFTTKAEVTTPGRYAFTSTGSGTAGAPSDLSWDFGDGASATGPTVTHDYDKPGTYRVTLAVTVDHTTKQVTHDVVVAAPTLGVRIVSSTKTSMLPGATTTVTVTVSAGDGLGDLHAPHWTDAAGRGLGSVPDGAYSVLAALAPALPADLAPGASVTLTGTVRAGSLQQAAAITSQLAATDAAGNTVAGKGSLTLPIADRKLTITLATDPGTFALPVSTAGVVGTRKVTTTVTFTNRTAKALTNVRLLSLQPGPADPTQQLDHLAFDPRLFPLAIASIPAGKAVTKRLTLTVTGDGKYTISALALYPDASAKGGNGRAAATGGDFEGTVPFLWYRAALDTGGLTEHGSGEYVRGGGSWSALGTIKNLSSYQSLCVDPLIADTTGNASSLGMVDVAESDADAGLPLAGTLAPGASRALQMIVRTSALGATRATARIPVAGYRARAGQPCLVNKDAGLDGAGAPLTAREQKIVAGSTDFTVHVDVSDDPSAAWSSGGLSFFGGYAKGSYEAFAALGNGVLGVIKLCGEHLAACSNPLNLLPELFAKYVGTAYDLTMTASRLMADYWRTAPAPERTSLIARLHSTFERAGNDAYTAVADQVDAFGEKFFADLLAAARSNDPDAEAKAWGELIGNGLTQLAALDLVTIFGKRLASSSSTLAARSEEATGAVVDGRAAAPLTTSKGGTVPYGRVLTLADQEGAWGITPSWSERISAIARKWKVKIGVRSRQQISVALEADGAVWKSSKFHQKTVNAADAYLGFSPGDRGLLAFADITDSGAKIIERSVQNSSLTAAEKTEVLDRIAARRAEQGAGYNSQALQMARTVRTVGGRAVTGWTDVGFNATESGRATSSVSRWRRYVLKETPLEVDGHRVGTYYKPYVENINYAAAGARDVIPALCERLLGTVLCPVTGDLDLVYVTDLLSNSLDSETMLGVFKDLGDAGFQHSDLVTWIDQQSGKFFFPGKESQLAGVSVGGEAVAEFAPDSTARATYLATSEGALVGPNQYWLRLLGTYTPAFK